MLRKIIAILAGIIIGMIVIAVVEYLGHYIFPAPVDLELSEEAYNQGAMYSMIPFKNMLMVLLAYLLGSFAAGFTTSIIAQNKILALIPGFALMIAGIINVMLIPHPLWFTFISLAVYVPFAFFGGFIAELLFIKQR
ncbi:MAG: hypothetical protein KJ578_08595 [Bacteroidetes bacterium]|nr:hypothetical protein [Bacteroidota bacterium]